jgi:hypothetical protein
MSIIKIQVLIVLKNIHLIILHTFSLFLETLYHKNSIQMKEVGVKFV